MNKDSIKQDVRNILNQCSLLDDMKEHDLVDLQFFYDENGLMVKSGYGNYGGYIMRNNPFSDCLYNSIDSTSENILQVIDELFFLYEELGEIVIKPDGDIYVHKFDDDYHVQPYDEKVR